MEQKTISISKQSLLKAYREAEPSQKEFMKQLFGAETFAINFNVMERVKTFQDAVNELGDVHPLVRQFVCVCNIAFNNSGVKLDADIIAYLKLRIIAAALNEGWEPKFAEDEYRYFPWFYFYTKEEYDKLDDEEKGRCVLRSGFSTNSYYGFVYCNAYHDASNSSTYDGSRLAFRTRELAEYAGKQFLDIWADFVFKGQDHE